MFEDEENNTEDDDEASFCAFVREFISMDCPGANACVAQPCANLPLCRNSQSQWVVYHAPILDF